MQLSDFNQIWNRQWPNLVPIAENLKIKSKHWVRFHTLPESKRYPDTDDELQLILSRHKQLINTLCKSKDIYIITADWTYKSGGKFTNNPQFKSKDYKNEHWMTIDQGEDVYRQLYIGNVNWPSKVFDELIYEVSDDQIGGIIVTSPELDWLYHPYDGGVDIVTHSESIQKALVTKYSEWLAPEWINLESFGNK